MAATIFPVLDPRQTSLSAFASEPVSLAGLKASSVHIEWHEAVAIIQELCGGLIDSTTEPEADDLNLDNVRIDNAGNVVAPRIQDSPSAVRQAGELLRGVLPDDFPVPLRLALSQSSSTPPFYASLKSFSQALEYFERPNRPAIIQAVYRRWDDRVLEKAKPEKSIPEPEREPKASAPRGASRALPRQFVLMAAIVGGALLAIVAALMLTLRVETPRAGSPMDSARSLGARAVETAGSVATAVIDRIGVPAKPPVSHAATPTEPPVSEPAPAAPTRRARPAPLNLSTPTVQGSARESEIAQVLDTPVPVVELVRQEVELVRQEPVGAVQQPSASIYSAENIDVSPPVAVYSQFPSPIEPRPRDASIFDIVIDRAGNVESVRARRPPTSMADAMVMTMSLSAAKTWRFQPAIKDGQPVRYRKTVWLPATP
jgi:hypothetical protein